MTYKLSMDPKQSPTLKQKQVLMMSPQMQQGIHLLQLPVQELSAIIEAEMEQNPLLEYIQEGEIEEDRDIDLEEPNDDDTNLEMEPEAEVTFDDQDFEILRRLDEDYREHFAASGEQFIPRTQDDRKKESYFESLIVAEPTLFDHLMNLAHETFIDPESLHIAEVIVGNLNENGFLDVPVQEIIETNNFDSNKFNEVLQAIQTFEPVGVGAKNLQESLLIQLKHVGKENSLAYAIVKDHFDDLLHNHLPQIQRSLKCKLTDINKALENDISKLDLHPSASFSHQPVQVLIPDIVLVQEGEKIDVRVNEEGLPSFKINPKYLRILEQSSAENEDKDFVKHKLYSAKWLMRNLHQRGETLEKIAKALVQRHRDFFVNPEGKITPLTMKILAEELELHESTIARAVSNKYIQSPRGIHPLRYFFSNAYVSEKGEQLSSKTVRDALLEIIKNEDKKHPYSDQALSFQLKLRGIDCARRTIAKYRAECNLGNAQQRRKY